MAILYVVQTAEFDSSIQILHRSLLQLPPEQQAEQMDVDELGLSLARYVICLHFISG